MKFLITGGDGQLARCLADILVKTEHEFVVVSRDKLDITDARSVKTVITTYRPDVIINAAAYTAVDRAEVEPDTVMRVNGEAVVYLAEAANKVGALLIQVSTDYVFDGDSPQAYTETDIPKPLCVYGVSKLAGERAAENAERYMIVRVAWLFSEYGNNFVKTMLKVGAERDELKIVSDQQGTPTYAGDLASALVQMAEASLPSGAYHFAGGEACSWYDFAQYIFQCAHEVNEQYAVPKLRKIKTIEHPTAARRPAFSVLSHDKLRSFEIAKGDWQTSVRPVIAKLLA